MREITLGDRQRIGVRVRNDKVQPKMTGTFGSNNWVHSPAIWKPPLLGIPFASAKKDDNISTYLPLTRGKLSITQYVEDIRKETYDRPSKSQ